MPRDYAAESRRLFWSKIDQSGGPDACWPWKGWRDVKDGYGVFGGKRAHRVMSEIEDGPIPNGINVLHTCDNPPCCNPKHLFRGTQLDNMRDKVQKGRGVFPGATHPVKGSGHGNALLNEEQVEVIRKEYVPRKTPLRVFAERFNVAISTVYYALKEGWKHVEVEDGN